MSIDVMRFPRNESGRDFVVGDIHGCLEHLETLMEQVEFDKDVDRMFSVGDLIDRGPKSLDVLRLINKPWFNAIQGNHEDMMIGELVGKQDMWWMRNGGEWSHGALEDHGEEFAELVKDTMALPILITVDTKACGVVGISHGESPKSWIDPDYTEKHDIIWGRNKVQWADHMGKVPEGVDMTVHGHTPIGSEPKHHKTMNAWWIDTGCFATGIMTMLQIDGEGLEEPKVFRYYIPKY